MKALPPLLRQRTVFWRKSPYTMPEMLALEKERPGSCALAAQECAHCTKCARLAGKPCLHPEQMRYALESLGMLAVNLVKDQFGFDVLWSDGQKRSRLLPLGRRYLRITTQKEGASHQIGAALPLFVLSVYIVYSKFTLLLLLQRAFVLLPFSAMASSYSSSVIFSMEMPVKP